MMRRASLVLGLSVVAALSGGCSAIRSQDTISIPNPLTVAPERPLADVPVPRGFTYKSNGSYVFSGNYRVAKLLYRGTPKVDECIEYFKEQMPASRWTFVKEAGGDEVGLVFQNEAPEELLVSLKRSAGITSLSIEIKPRRV
jgi:hypothetical protein